VLACGAVLAALGGPATAAAATTSTTEPIAPRLRAPLLAAALRSAAVTSAWRQQVDAATANTNWRTSLASMLDAMPALATVRSVEQPLHGDVLAGTLYPTRLRQDRRRHRHLPAPMTPSRQPLPDGHVNS
jgi:hypothetical protein